MRAWGLHKAVLNMRMRTLVIGDIHGCLTALEGVLDLARPAKGDWIITLGDYVDRGPDSKGVLNRLLRLDRTNQLVPLLGNHDQLFLDARAPQFDVRQWLSVGGVATLASYHQNIAHAFDSVPASHWDFLENRCRLYWEAENHFFVHGSVDSILPLSVQRPEELLWARVTNSRPHCSGKTMICGHTAQKSGLPLILPHAICIDTWVFGDGWLTCFDLEAGLFYQAREDGQKRTLTLLEAAEMAVMLD